MCTKIFKRKFYNLFSLTKVLLGICVLLATVWYMIGNDHLHQNVLKLVVLKSVDINTLQFLLTLDNFS